MCEKFLFFQRLETLCQVCHVIKYGKPDMTRFQSNGHMLRNRFVKLNNSARAIQRRGKNKLPPRTYTKRKRAPK